jgi:hypothetical protein
MNKNQKREESRGIPRTHFWIPHLGSHLSAENIPDSTVTLDSIVSPLLPPQVVSTKKQLLTLDSWLSLYSYCPFARSILTQD